MFEIVRLGKSGLKVSRIILGCQSFGTTNWEKWVLPEDESIKIIKAAYVVGFRNPCRIIGAESCIGTTQG